VAERLICSIQLQVGPLVRFVSMPTFEHKTKYPASDLRKWRKNKRELSDQLATTEDQLLRQQSKPPHEQNFNIQNHLTRQHHRLLAKDEQFHLQRARIGPFRVIAIPPTFTSPLPKEIGKI
jgi:hypothetical protein